MEAEILVFPCGEDLRRYERAIDNLFLDIRMEGLDGMETARELRRRGFRGHLIFMIVLEEMVFQAFEVSAYVSLCRARYSTFASSFPTRWTILSMPAKGWIKARDGTSG